MWSHCTEGTGTLYSVKCTVRAVNYSTWRGKVHVPSAAEPKPLGADILWPGWNRSRTYFLSAPASTFLIKTVYFITFSKNILRYSNKVGHMYISSPNVDFSLAFTEDFVSKAGAEYGFGIFKSPESNKKRVGNTAGTHSTWTITMRLFGVCLVQSLAILVGSDSEYRNSTPGTPAPGDIHHDYRNAELENNKKNNFIIGPIKFKFKT